MTLDLAADQLPPLAHVVAATAHVIDVDEGDGFCASVLCRPNGPAVARLDRSIRGALHEGDVLRWTIEHSTGAFGPGYFELRLTDEDGT